MSLAPVLENRNAWSARPTVARVLLAAGELTSRLTLKTLLTTAGYGVDCAASAAEAFARLDEDEYQLVLADLSAESEEAGPRLLAFARQKDYRPATALLSSEMSGRPARKLPYAGDSVVSVSNESLSHLLSGIADLISTRADRRMALRRAS